MSISDIPRDDHEETPIKETEVEAVQIELEVSGKEISETTKRDLTEESTQPLTCAEPDTSSPIDKEIRRRSSVVDDSEAGGCSHCLRKTFSGILILIRGWKTYMKYDVAFAGLGLATLYMTVLGFDNITVGKWFLSNTVKYFVFTANQLSIRANLSTIRMKTIIICGLFQSYLGLDLFELLERSVSHTTGYLLFVCFANIRQAY